jgi:peptide chain release factor
MKQEYWLQITAGKGPAECAWAVIQVTEKVLEEAAASGLEAKTIEIEPGPESGTALSAIVSISGSAGLQSFVNGWQGTILWIARSPFRPEHKRKNWFVGIEVLEPVEDTRFDTKELKWETMRASGPGGQHVNRTESAVRVTHLPTGIQASAAEERSQHRNRKLALARLARKLAEIGEKQQADARDKRWRAHQELERGNPVRTFRAGS